MFRPASEPAAAGSPYYERPDPKRSTADDLLLRGWSKWSTRALMPLRRRRLASFVAVVEAAGRELHRLSDPELRDAALGLRPRLLREGLNGNAAAEAFALAGEATTRQLGLRHHHVQRLGAAVMLSRSVAEMETGEGKTITALLTAATLALAGRPVHVLTVNEYLAQRDAEHLRSIYEALDLTVGLLEHGQPPSVRQAAYDCDVVYGTGKDVVFDYLRDRLALGTRRGRSRRIMAALTGGSPQRSLLLNGLFAAVVDEADSMLVDEARTPLILSGPSDAEAERVLFATALMMAESLQIGRDFQVLPRERMLALTEHGRDRLAGLADSKGGLWALRRAREELAEQALTALYFYHRDRHYIVAEGKVQIVDEFTGRVMPDREWENGLHQLIAAKEGCEITGRRQTIARITYQRFFRRYGHLCGMTGTAMEVATELRSVYDLKVVRVPTHRPSLRHDCGRVLFRHADDRWKAVVAAAAKVSAAGRAVLIGTRSVEASEYLAGQLRAAGLTPTILNARQDQEEAETIAGAGRPGRITVATNMAGRGTDIRLDQATRAAGGLHVILTEYHESGRIDRQLFGRGARQGDPGSFEAIVALDDELLHRFLPAQLQRMAARAITNGGVVPGWLTWSVIRIAQRVASQQNAAIRQETLRSDQRLEAGLAFAGRKE
jgi:preprotein translocase subunit SecA